MDVVALIISIFALIAAGAAAWYTRSYAITARRQTSLEHEPQFSFEVTRSARISGAGRPPVGGGPVFQLRNAGKGDAIDVTIALPGSAPRKLGDIKAGKTFLLGAARDVSATAEFSWSTVDGHRRTATLTARDLR